MKVSNSVHVVTEKVRKVSRKFSSSHGVKSNHGMRDTRKEENLFINVEDKAHDTSIHLEEKDSMVRYIKRTHPAFSPKRGVC